VEDAARRRADIARRLINIDGDVKTAPQSRTAAWATKPAGARDARALALRFPAISAKQWRHAGGALVAALQAGSDICGHRLASRAKIYRLPACGRHVRYLGWRRLAMERRYRAVSRSTVFWRCGHQ